MVLFESLLPGLDVSSVGIDEGAVDVEDDRAQSHGKKMVGLANRAQRIIGLGKG
jgi:hypothetical protein